jgi:hypothetical protein
MSSRRRTATRYRKGAGPAGRRGPHAYERRQRVHALCAIVLGVAALPPRAFADTDTGTHEATSATTTQSAHQGMFLPNTVAPSLANQAAAAVALAGYDDAVRSVVMSTTADVHVYGPLDLRLGLNYAQTTAPDASRAEPQLGLRLHLLSQADDGIEGAALINYRLDRYTRDEGLVQAMFVVGRRFGRAGVFVNLGFGQDPEGDDREGEAALAALYALSEPLQLGLESHARFDLFSSDPRRAARQDAAGQLTSGPTLHYVIGPCVLLTQVGVSTLVGIQRTRVGAVAVAGLGAAY